MRVGAVEALDIASQIMFERSGQAVERRNRPRILILYLNVYSTCPQLTTWSVRHLFSVSTWMPGYSATRRFGRSSRGNHGQ